jgi:hypothetical protein
LVAHAWSANFGFFGLGAGDLGRFLAVLIAGTVPLLAAALVAIHLPWSALALLGGGLVHQVQHAEVVLGVLEIAFGHHPITTARRIAAQLKVFFEQLLSGAADPDIRAVAIENMVSIERDTAPRVVAHTAAAATAATTSAATSARAVIAASHAFHVHSVAVVLSRYGAA